MQRKQMILSKEELSSAEVIIYISISKNISNSNLADGIVGS